MRSAAAAGDRFWWRSDGMPRSLAEIIDENARRLPDRVVLERRVGPAWHPVTTQELLAQVTALASGLVAAGIAPGDRVALMSETRYEWTLADAALWTVGAVSVPVYATASADQLAGILADSGATACIFETDALADRLGAAEAELPALRHRWQIDTEGGRETLAELAARGRGGSTDELRRRRALLTPDTPATIIYTSGTTGRPKGCVLTHGNFLAEIERAIEMLPELVEDDDATTLLFLPLAHVFGRMIQILVLLATVRTGHTDIGRIARDMPAVRPTFVLAVPRVFERILEGAERKAAASGRERIFALALDTAIAYSRALESGRPGLGLRARHAVFDRLAYRTIRAAFGGRLQWGISGGAALGPRLGHAFRGLGLTVLEGYGLTETTAATTVNTRRATRIGTVGRALPGVEVRIADDGEVVIRGPHVFRGYWHDAEATAAVLDAHGWFHTGDLGALDADGFLSITGRSKEILVTSTGKNVSPAPLEDVLRAHPLVSQALVIGDAQPQLTALLTVDPEALALWLEARDRPAAPAAELVDDADLRAALRTAVEAANATVSAAEAIARFRVLPIDFTIGGGQLTPTLKVKRAVVMAEFAADVQALYPKGLRDPTAAR